MLKCCARSLITLVLAIVATGIISTVCGAREFRSQDGSEIAASSVKQKSVALTGEPDQPLSPPPARNNTGGVQVPSSPTGPYAPIGIGGGLVDVFWWISWIWETRLVGPAL